MAWRVVHSFFADGRLYAAAGGTASQQMRHIQRQAHQIALRSDSWLNAIHTRMARCKWL